MRHLLISTPVPPATVADVVAPIAELIATASTRNAVLVGPMMRGVDGCVDVIVAYSHENGAGACEVTLGSWPSEQPQVDRDAIAREIYGHLIKTLKAEFHTGRHFTNLADFFAAAAERWAPCRAIDALKQRVNELTSNPKDELHAKPI